MIIIKRKILSIIVSALVISSNLINTNIITNAETLENEYSISDVLTIKKHILGISTEEKDINNDGVTNILDLIVIKNILLEDVPNVESTSVVVYFSCTGNTENIANNIAEVTNSDIFEIVPTIPYTDEDLDYNDDQSRVNYENNDDTIRPEIAITFENLEDYDTIYLGYPIWWGQAPKILYTFIESYDFTGKNIVPFCTSGGSSIGSSAENLKNACNGDANWLEGKRFNGSEDKDRVSNWIDTLNIN